MRRVVLQGWAHGGLGLCAWQGLGSAFNLTQPLSCWVLVYLPMC